MSYRNTTPITQSGVSDAGGKFTIPPNPYRHAILLSDPSGAGTYFILGTDDGSGKGIFLPSSGTPLILSCDDLGTGVQAAIELVNVVGAQVTFAWVEFLSAP